MPHVLLLFNIVSFNAHTVRATQDASPYITGDQGAAPYAHRHDPPSDSTQPYFSIDELWSLHDQLWGSFVYPANVEQARSINSSLIAEDCLGRVDLTRTFQGVELNTEYIFGLFVAGAGADAPFTLLGVPVSYEITKFAGNENIVSSSVIIQFEFEALKSIVPNLTVPVEIDAWITYNAVGQIAQYDATFRWFEFLMDSMTGVAMQALNVTDPATVINIFRQRLADSVCGIHQKHCSGTNQQYDDYTQCYDTLAKRVRFGKAYELGRNTLLCRMVHMNMVALRPEVHCSHIGPSGGGMCVDDQTYVEKVLQPYFAHMSFVPYGLQSSNAMVTAR